MEEWSKYFEVPDERVIYKDDEIVVFPDRAPRAATHLLVVPRHQYIRGVEMLQQKDIPLLQHMRRIGQQLSSSPACYTGFHQWPLRSVDHLHLHCIVPPFTRRYHKAMFTPVARDGDPIGYVSFDAIIKKLNAQQQQQ